MKEQYKIYHGDCLEVMKNIPDKSVDMVLCDLPYGVTKHEWDKRISLDGLWEQYGRIVKDNGAIVLFGVEPFSSLLRVSNISMYKYDWIWNKSKPLGFINAKRMPLKDIENISVFYKKLPTYNPQGLIPYGKEVGSSNKRDITAINGGKLKEGKYVRQFKNYPRQLLKFDVEQGLHPTQKPVELLEYLIKTYTNDGEIVLDNCMGSGSTGVACVNTNRKFIGIELDENYFNIAKERIEEAVKKKEELLTTFDK